MKKFYKKAFRFLFFVLALTISTLNASAALSKGDLAVIGMNSDPDAGTTIRSFAVVALNTINAGELIYFTDRGWVNAYGSTPGHFVGALTNPTPSVVITNEGIFQWQPSVTISAGTVIVFKIDLASRTVSAMTGTGTSLPSADLSILPNSWTNGTLSANPWPTATGDQLIIYQGSEVSPSFIFAFNNIRLNTAVGTTSNGWHINSAGTEPPTQLNAYSEVPSDLGTIYSTAFFTNTTNSRYPNEKYNPSSSSGSKATILADITNTANWVNPTAPGTAYNFSLGFGANNITQFNLDNTTVPTVMALSPTSGPTSGGTSVTIIGTNFSGATAVTFGATAATGFTVNSATQITATAPAGTGTVDVRITTTGGTSATSASDQFTYVARPAVTALSPTSGPTSGGTSVTITGTNFSGATAVTFGATAATGFTVNSATQITATAPAGTGTVDVRITTNGGTSATSASDQFTYVARSTVTALSPTSGSTSGGTSVTITGTNFSGATVVTFGATSATGFTVNSATQITATAPAGTGTVDVSVTTTGGTSAASVSDQFTYVARPTVTALNPISGPTGGGTSVTITGTNFSGATAVTFGATAATSFSVNSATQITATAPAGTGTVDVSVTTLGGTSATSASDQFTYVARPTVTALSPTSGPASGGTTVTVTGTNFSGATAVTFGATAATGFTVNSATQITATAPAGTGTVDVRITTTGGTSATSISDQFTYAQANQAPVVTATGGSTTFSGSAVVIDNALTVSDLDNTTLSAATIAITGNFISGQDILAFTANFTLFGSIAGSYNSTTGVLTLTSSGSTATVAQWQAALRSIAYNNTAGSPNTATRTISYTVNDGTANSNTATKNVSVINQASVTSIVRISSNPINASTVQYTVTFDKSITGITTSNFSITTTGTVSGVSISSVSGSGNTYTVTVNTGTGSGSLTLNLANATGITPSISTSLPFAGETYTLDKTSPTMVISSTAGASGSSTSTSPIPFTVTFSEFVTGFVLGDITPGNATISGFSGSGMTYTFNGTPTANGVVTMNIAANVAQDAAGNGNSAASPFSITYAQAVTAAPVVVSPANGSLINTTTPTYTGTATSGATVTVYVDGTAIGTTTATGGNWSLTQPTALVQGLRTVYATAQVPGTAVSANSNTNTFTVDSQRPSVVISSTAGASGGSTGTSPIPFTVTFSESVTGFVAGDITPGNATITGFSGSGTTYTFNATPAANGAVTVNIAANVAQDVAGNGNTAASQFAITYTLPSVIIASAGTFPSALNTTYGTASASTSVTVSGTGLTAGIIATPSSTSNFEVSADDVNYSSSVTFGSSGNVSGTVYVRLKANAPAGTNIIGNVVFTSSGANSPIVSIPSSTVTKATLTYTANTSSKAYGDAVPALSGTVTGFVNSETISTATTGTISWSTSATTNSAAGSYGITGTGLSASNYNFVQASSNSTALTITPKTITVTAAVKSKTFGDADPALTYTFAPTLQTGDSFTGSLTRLPGENVGTYAINQGTLALNSNYSLTYVGANLTIAAKTITVTAAEKSKAFGDADPALTYTFAPALQTGDSFIGSLSRLPGENVGTYAINQGTLALNSNYILTYGGANLTIAAKTIMVTAAAKSKTFGDADPALTYTFAPALATGDTVTGSLVRVPGENVGTYAINKGTLLLSNNYALTYVGADLTIAAKTITVTAAAKGKTFGDADPALTYTFAPALATGDTFTGSLVRVPGENVGTYAINRGTLSLSNNYALTYVGGDLTIAAKTITVTATAKGKTFGDADPALTYTFAPALATGDAFTGSLTRVPGENVGTYAINKGTLALNGNYALTYVGADLTIAAKTITVTAAAKGKTFGDADPALTYIFAPALATGDAFTGSLVRLPGENMGTYAINRGTLALSANYALTYVGADLTIAAKTITVTAAAKGKTFGDADPALTYTFAPALQTGDSFTGSLSRLPGENVGTYAINQGTLALNSNYSLTYVGADLTIAAKTITVTAAAKSKTFGDADPALTYTFAPALATGDTFTGSLVRVPGENVGTYAINKGTLSLSNNYALTYVGADLTIAAKTITVTAAAKGKTFGDADPALTYTFAPALAIGDTFTGSLVRAPGENVGTYAINRGTLALSANYALTYVGSDLTIAAKTITVTAAAKVKTFGDADPALTYTFAPALATGDTFTGSLVRVPGENVGTYAINRGTLALNGNYALTYVGADLTIAAKTITVTAAAKSKTFGDADPALTYTFAPALATGDTFTGSLVRAPGENVGTYAINKGSLALSSNYALTYVGADLTIAAKTITVTAAAKGKIFGDADPALTYTFAPALATGDTFTGSLVRLPGENVGTYAINQGTLGLSSNYSVTYVGADFTIAAKTITVTAAAKGKTFGDADPALTYTFAPALATGDTFSGSLVRVPGENVGTYAINRGTLSLSNNYALTYVGADLTIAAKTITVTAAAKGKTFGDADPALTYTFAPALAAGDTFTGSLVRVPGENVGTYAINRGTLSLSNNYTLTYVGADLTIAAKTITVTAAAKGKTFGDADPALTYTFAPALATGDTFSGSLVRVSGENVGTYAISQGSLALSSNYTIAYISSNLTITKSILTITASNAVMCQSDGFPTFGITYTGFKTGDNENSLITKPMVSTNANRNVAGNYLLVASGGASNNYSLVYVNGTLTINAIPSISVVSNKGTEISKGETVIITASGGTAYSWSTASGIISGQNTASLSVRPSQTTTYTVRVTNASGCVSSASITIKVNEDYKLVANNILTPNGDGVNDTWIVQNIDMYPSNEVRIFDRNSREMYSKKSYDNSWNGTIGGNDLAEGTYYYIITYGPNKLVQKGFITIIRNR